MPRKTPETGDEPQPEEIEEILSRARSLTARVERMPDGPKKVKLKAAIYVVGDEIKTIALARG